MYIGAEELARKRQYLILSPGKVTVAPGLQTIPEETHGGEVG